MQFEKRKHFVQNTFKFFVSQQRNVLKTTSKISNKLLILSLDNSYLKN